MISDPKKTIDNIVAWLKQQAEARNLNSLIIYIGNESIATSVAYRLCKRTLLNVHDINYDDYINMNGLIADCSKRYKALIVSARCKNDNLFIRDYDKFEPVDVMPLANFKFSEVEQLHKAIPEVMESTFDKALRSATAAINMVGTGKIREGKLIKEGPRSYVAKQEPISKPKPPKSDHGISQEELEWLEELDKHSHIITSNKDPAKEHSWFKFTMRQKEVIAKVHQMEKLTRHKHNPNIPIFKNEP